MKIEATITKVESSSASSMTMDVSVEGWHEAEPQGVTARPIATFEVLRNATTEAAYHVGRKLVITIEPK